VTPSTRLKRLGGALMLGSWVVGALSLMAGDDLSLAAIVFLIGAVMFLAGAGMPWS